MVCVVYTCVNGSLKRVRFLYYVIIGILVGNEFDGSPLHFKNNFSHSVKYRALVITCTTAAITTTDAATAILPPDPDDHLRTWVENPSQYNKANTGR